MFTLLAGGYTAPYREDVLQKLRFMNGVAQKTFITSIVVIDFSKCFSKFDSGSRLIINCKIYKQRKVNILWPINRDRIAGYRVKMNIRRF